MKKLFTVQYRSVKPFNLGPYVARNHGCQEADTQYLCFQDSDDNPRKIASLNYTIMRYRIPLLRWLDVMS
ncbi:glycosyltransferase family A protein [Okeania sp. SIO2C2]|uniref:glycosyltransferase family A protein n=1 Tax=Okeania sp. SIO2C2 TaxID=2607787 RepID=UPI00338F6E14